MNLESDILYKKANKVTVYKLILIFLPVLIVISVLIYLLVRNSKTEMSPNVSLGGKSVILTAGFPDIPVYPQAQLIDSTKDEQSQGGPFYTTHWAVGGQVSEIMTWYTDKLTHTGWSVFVTPGDSQSPNIQFSEFRKGESYLQLSVVKNQQKISIEALVHPTPLESKEGEGEAEK
jgi:hypothetical protein